MVPRGRLIFACAFAASCSFSAQSLDPGDPGADASIPLIDAPPGTIDASIDLIDADPAAPDAADVDAMFAIDAAFTPDAFSDLCTGGSTLLALSTTFADFAPPSGDDYTPVCAPVDDDDAFYRVMLEPPAAGMDLVVDLDDSGPDNPWDGVVDLSTNCTTSIGAATCSDVTSGGNGEVVVETNVTAGPRYIVIDKFATAGNPDDFRMRAFLRPVRTAVAAQRSCDPLLVTSRCDATSYCVDTAGNAQCTALVPITEVSPNGECNDAQPITVDSAVTGSVQDFDQDWFRLPAGNVTAYNLRAVLYTANGGCAADFRLRVFSGNSCPNVVEEAVDDNSGLGSCPVLVLNGLDAAVNTLVVDRPRNRDNSIGYNLVIDFL